MSANVHNTKQQKYVVLNNFAQFD